MNLQAYGIGAYLFPIRDIEIQYESLNNTNNIFFCSYLIDNQSNSINYFGYYQEPFAEFGQS